METGTRVETAIRAHKYSQVLQKMVKTLILDCEVRIVEY